jgi:hypothetical protein
MLRTWCARSISSSSSRGTSRRFLCHHLEASSSSRTARGVKRTVRGPEPRLPIIRQLSFLGPPRAATHRRLRDLPHLRKHIAGRDQLPTLRTAVPVQTRPRRLDRGASTQALRAPSAEPARLCTARMARRSPPRRRRLIAPVPEPRQLAGAPAEPDRVARSNRLGLDDSGW